MEVNKHSHQISLNNFQENMKNSDGKPCGPSFILCPIWKIAAFTSVSVNLRISVSNIDT